MLVAFALVFTTISCSKDDYSSDGLEFISSNTVPSLSIDEGSPVNLIELNGSADVYTFNTNVPYITGKFDKPNPNICCRMEGASETAGTNSLTATRMDNVTYTADEPFVLVENPFNGQWVNYCNDGPLQMVVTVRIRGTKGTKYIDLKDPIGTAVQRDDAKFNYDTYAKGTLKAVSGLTSGTEKRANDAQKCWGGHYPQLANDSYASVEYVTITITDGESDVDIKVWGAKRENEIGRLLEYVREGDMVEVPATTLTTKNMLNQVHASAVLKLD